MGFWSSLVNSTAQVTHWLSNNAGSIKKAAEVIFKVAGVPLMTEEELAEEGGNILPTLKSHLHGVEKKLLTKAVEGFPQPKVPAGYTLKVVDLAALWPTPSAHKDIKVVPEIGIDINKLLTYEKVPTSAGSPPEDAIREENLALAIKQDPDSLQAGGSYNSATLSVQWNGSRGVATIMSDAVTDMLKRAQGQVKFSEPAVVDGTRFKYQFRSSTEMGPAEVAGMLSSSTSFVIGPPPEKDPHRLTRMPTVRVSNLQTFIS
ncbi:hypothetical protein NM208_g6717 [Fusarium decemcellulare]|uniref:Uncharacterized protein n=1 Tax=Fusarium decemcellulare TaxID=57161 RepID=A0ACC1SC54_9HYPO|nr:hypothetical protein NM208_g6717 [Fusarium decemcellulare]